MWFVAELMVAASENGKNASKTRVEQWKAWPVEERNAILAEAGTHCGNDGLDLQALFHPKSWDPTWKPPWNPLWTPRGEHQQHQQLLGFLRAGANRANSPPPAPRGPGPWLRLPDRPLTPPPAAPRGPPPPHRYHVPNGVVGNANEAGVWPNPGGKRIAIATPDVAAGEQRAIVVANLQKGPPALGLPPRPPASPKHADRTLLLRTAEQRTIGVGNGRHLMRVLPSFQGLGLPTPDLLRGPLPRAALPNAPQNKVLLSTVGTQTDVSGFDIVPLETFRKTCAQKEEQLSGLQLLNEKRLHENRGLLFEKEQLIASNRSHTRKNIQLTSLLETRETELATALSQILELESRAAPRQRPAGSTASRRRVDAALDWFCAFMNTLSRRYFSYIPTTSRDFTFVRRDTLYSVAFLCVVFLMCVGVSGSFIWVGSCPHGVRAVCADLRDAMDRCGRCRRRGRVVEGAGGGGAHVE